MTPTDPTPRPHTVRGTTVPGTNDGSFAPKTNSAPATSLSGSGGSGGEGAPFFRQPLPHDPYENCEDLADLADVRRGLRVDGLLDADTPQASAQWLQLELAYELKRLEIDPEHDHCSTCGLTYDVDVSADIDRTHADPGTGVLCGI